MSEPDVDSAQVLATRSAASLRTDGPVLTETLEALENGYATGEPTPKAVLTAVVAQAVQILESMVECYESEVAAGEVGAEGSSRAGLKPPLAGGCPTGLMYGRVQSGKTLAMIALAALAFDNGFRTIVVLTSDNVKLVEQTAERFEVLTGPLVRQTTDAQWNKESNHVKAHLASHGLILIASKNPTHLQNCLDFLEVIGACDHPALIFDDEADQATPDTTTAARKGGRSKNPPAHGSTISRITVENDHPGEKGQSIREKLRHNLFLQVTATPYALLLQNTDSPFRPKFTRLLEPGDGYTGGEAFFDPDIVGRGTDDPNDGPKPPLVLVPEQESDTILTDKEVPSGLEAAIHTFLVACAAQAKAKKKYAFQAQNFLCHTSQKKLDHEQVSALVQKAVTEISAALPELLGSKPALKTRASLEKAIVELGKTVAAPPSFAEVVTYLRGRLPQSSVSVVNSDTQRGKLPQKINFIVGGNILGRGLTIPNLLVTYYLRRAKVSQMDTVLQHARMFGYRREIMPYTRVFIPLSLAQRFSGIHESEANLRELLSDPELGLKIPIATGQGLRTTRANVLDTTSLVGIAPGAHAYPRWPGTIGGSAASAQRETERQLCELFGLGAAVPNTKFAGIKDVSIEQVIEALRLIPVEDPFGDSNWDVGALIPVLKGISASVKGRARLYCRHINHSTFTQGAVSGPELSAFKEYGQPVFCLFRDAGARLPRDPRDLKGSPPIGFSYVYPELVLPKRGIPAHLFNVTE